MSYKKKVEKALELIGKEDKPTLESVIEPKDFIQQIESKYNIKFPVRLDTFSNDCYINLHWVYLHSYKTDFQCIIIENNVSYVEFCTDLRLTHIKTLEQFEQLYFSLTGKELCQVKQTG